MPPRTGMADDSHEFQLVLERLRLNDPEITNVRIAAWSPEFAGRLSAALRVNSHLRTLEVDGAAVSAGQKMGAEGGVMLAKAIESHPQLQRLHVNFHNLGDVGVGALAGALQWNQHVRDVAVNSNKMGRAGAESLAALLRENNTLTALSLGGNSEASPAGVIALAEALMHNTSLRELNLSFIPLNANGVSQALAQLLGAASCRLSNLRAVDCRLDAESIVPLAQALHSCSSLTSLDLSENNRLRDDGCTQLAHALISNSCLTNLLLNWSGIGDSGATALGTALQSNTSLRVLGLDHNTAIGHAGASALADGLHANGCAGALEELHLRGLGKTQAVGDSGSPPRTIARALRARPPAPHFRILQMDRDSALNSPQRVADLGLPAHAKTWPDHQIFALFRSEADTADLHRVGEPEQGQHRVHEPDVQGDSQSRRAVALASEAEQLQGLVSTQDSLIRELQSALQRSEHELASLRASLVMAVAGMEEEIKEAGTIALALQHAIKHAQPAAFPHIEPMALDSGIEGRSVGPWSGFLLRVAVVLVAMLGLDLLLLQVPWASAGAKFKLHSLSSSSSIAGALFNPPLADVVTIRKHDSPPSRPHATPPPSPSLPSQSSPSSVPTAPTLPSGLPEPAMDAGGGGGGTWGEQASSDKPSSWHSRVARTVTSAKSWLMTWRQSPNP